VNPLEKKLGLQFSAVRLRTIELLKRRRVELLHAENFILDGFSLFAQTVSKVVVVGETCPFEHAVNSLTSATTEVLRALLSEKCRRNGQAAVSARIAFRAERPFGEGEFRES
jgi:hypothetical protein